MPRITDTKIERALLEMRDKALDYYRQDTTNAYAMGRAHMIIDVIEHLQSETFYFALDLDQPNGVTP
jgi:hypothetical protein